MQQTVFRHKQSSYESISGYEALQKQIKQDRLKRGFDLLFSLIILTIFSPLYLLLFLLIKLSSKGPAFYKGKRLGQGGRIIECLKFRTMYKDADSRLNELLMTNPEMKHEWNTFRKLKNDPRITPLGHFLRKTSLDELPQFINVLKGDLSVVGPRPPALLGPPELYLQEVARLYGDYTATILSVRPGITGVWQVSGRSALSLEEKRKLELFYVETRTFWQDLKVILQTIPAVLFSKGAF